MIAAPEHHAELQRETVRLLSFGAAAVQPGVSGAAYLDENGQPDPSKGTQTWITSRMVHSFALGSLMGLPGCAALGEAAMAGLTGPLFDQCNGGWFHAISADGTPDLTSGKWAYDHAFVMFAAASASIAGFRGATTLFEQATATFLEHFWDADFGRPVDTWNVDFTELDPYRGLNATMHTLEALLNVAAALPLDQGASWLRRADQIGEFVVKLAREHASRLPEHFDSNWVPNLQLNVDRPGDRFKPFGATPGHGFEWSRLLLNLEAALDAAGEESNPAYLPTAIDLFDRAVADGWAADGADGFVYTTDWQGEPVVRERMHWVLCEALGAAASLHQRTGDARYPDLYASWWQYAQTYLIDEVHGSWHHELDPQNRPSAKVWSGKPDIYHALQAVLIPRLPLAPAMAGAIRDGALRNL